MSMISRYTLCVMAVIAVVMSGCSQIEPQTGTRVTFSIDSQKPLSRPQVAQLSRYLVKKSGVALNADRARIDSVDKTTLVLLLPGKKIEKKRVGQLLYSGVFEFMHLTNVATDQNTGRPWRLSLPQGKQKSYLFTGSDGKRLDSANDSENLIMTNVVSADQQPILSGKDMEPTAMYQQTKHGWALLIRFNKSGAKKLQAFTSANKGEYLAMFDRDKLISAAEIVDPIEGGEVFLTGFTTEEQVNSLVTDINGADLPRRLQVKSVEYY